MSSKTSLTTIDMRGGTRGDLAGTMAIAATTGPTIMATTGPTIPATTGPTITATTGPIIGPITRATTTLPRDLAFISRSSRAGEVLKRHDRDPGTLGDPKD